MWPASPHLSALTIISKGKAYGSGFHTAPKELAEFIQALTYLKFVLGGLDILLRIRAAVTSVGHSELSKGLARQGGAVNDCQSALEAIKKSLEMCERNPGSKKGESSTLLFLPPDVLKMAFNQGVDRRPYR